MTEVPAAKTSSQIKAVIEQLTKGLENKTMQVAPRSSSGTKVF